jgi:alkanesulfonate monooxygenase SsuD/methylene tetrahydromethanopterin reductase-like flavin-dependent oxidoreductase (luciferase family)
LRPTTTDAGFHLILTWRKRIQAFEASRRSRLIERATPQLDGLGAGAGVPARRRLPAIWVSRLDQRDAARSPFSLALGETPPIEFGTAVAIGFARSPTVLAHTAWDLARASGGRFTLGLGTQVRPHIERRYGMGWPASPVGAMREYIQGLRAVWHAWQTGERLNQRGEFYRLTLMTLLRETDLPGWPTRP